MDSVHWIEYLYQNKDNQDMKIYMKNRLGEVRSFKPHLKEVFIDDQNLHIVIFDDLTDELQKINSLEEKASTDALTGLFNKGKFNAVVAQEMELALTTTMPLSLIFLDIDHFKRVNDTYGHDTGDYVLKEIAKILVDSVRKGDFVARWGGEEFIITLQAITANQAKIVAEKIRHNIEAHSFIEGGRQTVSLGVTQYIFGESEDKFLKRVDEALYEAKASGRNKVVQR
jgi:diguanylate cyclase (GGDEF)-like protein